MGERAHFDACLLETMLFSSDFHAVNEPTYSAVDLFKTMHGADPILPPFVLEVFEEVKRTPELAAKRALWLVMLRSLPPVSHYVTTHAKQPDRAHAMCAWLESEVEGLFTGKYHAFGSPLDEFVVAAQVYYNSF